MGDLERLVNDDPDFKDLAKLITHEHGGPTTVDILIDHIKKSKEHKLLSEVFPMILNNSNK
jgi:hypothetical protein